MVFSQCRELQGKRGRKDCRTQRMEDMSRTWLTDVANQGSHGPTETDVTSMEPAWVCDRTAAYILCLSFWCFHWTPNSGSTWISESSASSWYFFPPLGLPCPASTEELCFVLVYLVIFYLIVIS